MPISLVYIIHPTEISATNEAIDAATDWCSRFLPKQTITDHVESLVNQKISLYLPLFTSKSHHDFTSHPC